MPTVLVTGAGRGLGLEFARQYAKDGWQVHACARAPEKSEELRQIPGLHIHKLDVTDFAAIDALAKEIKDVALDVLIHCAGSMGRSTPFGSSDFNEWEYLFRLNTLAPMKTSEAFLQHVLRGEQKKIVALSTLMASMAKNEMGAFYGYRSTKAALNAVLRSMSIDFGRKHGIIAIPIHPGWVRTDMGGPRAELMPETSVSGMRRVIAGLTKEQSGRFWSYDGSEIPW